MSEKKSKQTDAPGALLEQMKDLVGGQILTRPPEMPRLGVGDPSSVGGAFAQLMVQMAADPAAMANAQLGFAEDSAKLWMKCFDHLILWERSDKETTDVQQPKGQATSRSDNFKIINAHDHRARKMTADLLAHGLRQDTKCGRAADIDPTSRVRDAGI